VASEGNSVETDSDSDSDLSGDGEWVSNLPSSFLFFILPFQYMFGRVLLPSAAAGCWVLAAGCWVLAAGCWVLGWLYIAQPAPCSLLPMLPAPCSMLPAPCSLLPAACCLLPAACCLI
jgi:hypothetical protein